MPPELAGTFRGYKRYGLAVEGLLIRALNDVNTGVSNSEGFAESPVNEDAKRGDEDIDT